MPAALTYPGVYVEEIPSSVHTIVGVATSITAFVGRAERGPVNVATTINSFGDFQKQFGGLWEESSLGYAVNDFYLNGGAQAIIVRLYNADPGNAQANPPVPAPATKATLTVGNISFIAADEGLWGLSLRATVDQTNIPADVATAMGLATSDLFNLTVVDESTNATEKYMNLSVKNSSRRVDNVLAELSSLLYCNGTPDATKPIVTGQDHLGTLETAVTNAQTTLTNDQNSGAAQATITADQNAVTTAKTALDTALNTATAALSDGLQLTVLNFLPAQGQTAKLGIYALEQADLFNILCLPPYNPDDVDVNLIAAAGAYCEKRRAMLIVDAPSTWTTKDLAKNNFTANGAGTSSANAAIYFPRLQYPNPLHDNQTETFAACGAMAGTWAATDTARGVWKAPAGIDASLTGVTGFSVPLTDDENGELNPLGVNCLRSFPVYGRIVWGARTLRGADALADQYKYIPVRRTALYIEESLYRGLKWVVFEPNDDRLWAQIRLNVGAFMQNMFRQGAFQGTTATAAYFVKCDGETTLQNDIDLGVVNVVVGFAPLKPAEFVVIQLQQMAGQIQS
jgi:uncharacterized protein